MGVFRLNKINDDEFKTVKKVINETLELDRDGKIYDNKIDIESYKEIKDNKRVIELQNKVKKHAMNLARLLRSYEQMRALAETKFKDIFAKILENEVKLKVEKNEENIKKLKKENEELAKKIDNLPYDEEDIKKDEDFYKKIIKDSCKRSISPEEMSKFLEDTGKLMKIVEDKYRNEKTLEFINYMILAKEGLYEDLPSTRSFKKDVNKYMGKLKGALLEMHAINKLVEEKGDAKNIKIGETNAIKYMLKNYVSHLKKLARSLPAGDATHKTEAPFPMTSYCKEGGNIFKRLANFSFRIAPGCNKGDGVFHTNCESEEKTLEEGRGDIRKAIKNYLETKKFDGEVGSSVYWKFYSLPFVDNVNSAIEEIKNERLKERNASINHS